MDGMRSGGAIMGEADLPVRDLHRLRCVLPQATSLPLGVRKGVHGDVPPDAGTEFKPTASRRANRRLLVQRKHTPVQSEHTRYHVAATMRRRLPCTGAVAAAARAGRRLRVLRVPPWLLRAQHVWRTDAGSVSRGSTVQADAVANAGDVQLLSAEHAERVHR